MTPDSLALLSNEALAEAYLVQQTSHGLGGEPESAFTELFRRHRELVYRICIRWLRHHQDAEDVTQETFRRVAASIHHWDRNRPIEPWLATIAGNRCRTLLAQRRAAPQLADIETTGDVIASDGPPAAAMFASQAIDEALGSLSNTSRRAFEMVHLQGLSYEQVARTMNHPAGTIKTWVHRARLTVIERLRESTGDNAR